MRAILAGVLFSIPAYALTWANRQQEGRRRTPALLETPCLIDYITSIGGNRAFNFALSTR